mmetsp:Transcript_54993/g.91277  ORF Transcript_54993/g.91277 Transcript_54993/m.91277 type:complete len:245 (+) Transcript_54993:307-1041(+)
MRTWNSNALHGAEIAALVANVFHNLFVLFVILQIIACHHLQQYQHIAVRLLAISVSTRIMVMIGLQRRRRRGTLQALRQHTVHTAICDHRVQWVRHHRRVQHIATSSHSDSLCAHHHRRRRCIGRMSAHSQLSIANLDAVESLNGRIRHRRILKLKEAIAFGESSVLILGQKEGTQLSIRRQQLLHLFLRQRVWNTATIQFVGSIGHKIRDNAQFRCVEFRHIVRSQLLRQQVRIIVCRTTNLE